MAKLLAGTEAHLSVFGELYLSGYMCRDAFPRLAEPIGGKSISKVSRLATEHGTDILVGFPEKEESTATLYNSAVFCGADGRVERYRKIYPANFGPFEELEYFRPGSELKMVDSQVGRLGLMICYDTFFPEVAKALALRGAEILAVISAAPASSKPFFDKVLVARAIENAVFVLYSNLVGTELNVVFAGGTQAIGPRGEELGRAEDFHEGRVEVMVDPQDLAVARRFRPTLRDTRPEILDLLRKSLD
jgi:predicted amidohydrolase